MSTIHRFRPAIPAIVAMLMVALSAPLAVSAEEQVIADEQVLVAEDQVPALAPVAGPSWDETSGYYSVEASRAVIGHLAASTTQVPSDVRWAPARAIAPGSSVEATRVLVAQQALQFPNLGSMQEEALLAVVAAAPSWDATSGYGAVEASRATIGHPATSTTGEAAHLAQFRAVELSLSRYLGAEQPVTPSCDVVA